MKKLMMTTAIVAATSFGAAAQTGDGTGQTGEPVGQTDMTTSGQNGAAAGQADMTTGQNGAAAGQTMVPAFLATDFTGMTLYTLDSETAGAAGQPQGDATAGGQPQTQRWTSSDVFMAERDNWESVGSISDIVMSQDGEVRGILIDVGGFLGMFARTVMVDIEELYFVADDATAVELNDFYVVAGLTREQLEALPEWSEEMLHAGFEYRAGQQGAMDGTMQDGAQADGTMQDGTMQNGAQADGAMQDGTMQDGAQADGTMQDGTMQDGAQTDGTMQDGTQDDAAMGPVPGEATEDGQIGAPGTPAAIQEGYVMVDPTVPTAEQLTDADVYDAAGDHIGNVNDAILDPEQGVREVIVDVGGFLGLGTHTVALPVDSAEILWNEQTDSVRIHLDMTREQLESLPAVDG